VKHGGSEWWDLEKRSLDRKKRQKGEPWECSVGCTKGGGEVQGAAEYSNVVGGGVEKANKGGGKKGGRTAGGRAYNVLFLGGESGICGLTWWKVSKRDLAKRGVGG